MDADDTDGLDLMPLDTPILKVSRPVAACLRCRNAKIKCDGKLPACTSCERTGRSAECTSTNDQFARGKERSYVSTLETRIDKLRTKLEDARRRKPSVVSVQDDETIVPSRRHSIDEQEAPTPPTTTKALRRKEASAIDDLVSDFGFLSVNATARDFYGFTSAMSYARLIIWACSRDQLPQGVTKALPPRYVTTQLIQHYLNTIFHLVPSFDEASFYASIDSLYHPDTDEAKPIDHWMVRMVLAVACVSMSERSGDQSYLEGIGHVCAALEHSEAVLHPGALTSVQALVLLVQYAMLDPHHFDAWSLIGAASRAMSDLGLHQDPPKGAPMLKGQLELRRRVFWSVYVLDRSTSLVQTRAFSFSDDSAKVKVPFSKQPSSAATSPAPEAPETPRAWLYSHDQALDLISLRQIQSSWYTDLFQSGRTTWEEPYHYIWNTCDKMKKWFENISCATPAVMRTYFELELFYSYVYVLAPSPRVPVITPFAQILIFEYCIRYAELMLALLNDPDTSAPINFNDAMRVYMTGRQFLDILQQNTDGLLNGITPARPEVRPSTAPPPQMPQVAYPPNESVPYFNTVRAIACIKRLIDCLARFGQRWGYLSWSQLYSSETAAMVEELTQRQRGYEMMNGMRRPSAWHSGSQGSLGSSSSSIAHFAHTSPNNSISSQTRYQSPPAAPAVQSASSFADGTPQPLLTPPLHHQPQHFQQPVTMPGAYPEQAYSPPDIYRTTQQRAPPRPFNFADPAMSMPHQVLPTAPHQQFGAWQGYSGPTATNNDVDEETSIPPNTYWTQPAG